MLPVLRLLSQFKNHLLRNLQSTRGWNADENKLQSVFLWVNLHTNMDWVSFMCQEQNGHTTMSKQPLYLASCHLWCTVPLKWGFSDRMNIRIFWRHFLNMIRATPQRCPGICTLKNVHYNWTLMEVIVSTPEQPLLLAPRDSVKA